jgi:hypothetical protein
MPDPVRLAEPSLNKEKRGKEPGNRLVTLGGQGQNDGGHRSKRVQRPDPGEQAPIELPLGSVWVHGPGEHEPGEHKEERHPGLPHGHERVHLGHQRHPRVIQDHEHGGNELQSCQ